MPIEHYLITGTIGLVTGVGGIVIGYYRSEANVAKNYISKKDCEGCAMKVEISHLAKDLSDAAKSLKTGDQLFTDLRIDIELIKQKLKINDDKLKRQIIRDQIAKQKTPEG